MSVICDFITGQTLIDTDDERIRQGIERLLVEEKGYSKEDIEVDREFEIVEAIRRIEFKGLPEDRREKEKRIFLAFESIKSEECGFH